jgi:hypothetical protein
LREANSLKNYRLPNGCSIRIKDKIYSEEVPHALFEDEIYEFIEKFALAVARAKKQILTAYRSMLRTVICSHLFCLLI